LCNLSKRSQASVSDIFIDLAPGLQHPNLFIKLSGRAFGRRDALVRLTPSRGGKRRPNIDAVSDRQIPFHERRIVKDTVRLIQHFGDFRHLAIGPDPLCVIDKRQNTSTNSSHVYLLLSFLF
jgi:hypothetical protein